MRRNNKPQRIALLGLGQLGTAVLDALLELKKNGDTSFDVRVLCDVTKAPDILPKDVLYIPNWEDAIKRADVDVVIEAVGGVRIAYEIAAQAMSHGKSVVTANSTLMGGFGKVLTRISQGQGVHLRAEGAVLGTFPATQVLSSGLVGNTPESLTLTLADGANLVLERMEETGETAHHLVDILGLQENNLHFNAKGLLYKMSVLRAAAFGVWTDVAKASVESVLNMTPDAVRLARQMGYQIRMFARADAQQLHVGPQAIPADVRLADTAHGQKLEVNMTCGERMVWAMEGESSALSRAVRGVVHDVLSIAQQRKPLEIQEQKQVHAHDIQAQTYFAAIPQAALKTVHQSRQWRVIRELDDMHGGTCGVIVQSTLTASQLADAWGYSACVVPLIAPVREDIQLQQEFQESQKIAL